MWHGHWPVPFNKITRACVAQLYRHELGGILQILKLKEVTLGQCQIGQVLQLDSAASAQQKPPGFALPDMPRDCKACAQPVTSQMSIRHAIKESLRSDCNHCRSRSGSLKECSLRVCNLGRLSIFIKVGLSRDTMGQTFGARVKNVR